MADLKASARELDKALTALAKALETYYAAAVAAGRETADPSAIGMDARQLRQKIEQHVISRLSPKPIHGQPKPVMQLAHAPEARRHAAAHPLPGLK